LLGLSIVDKAIPKHNTQKEILAKRGKDKKVEAGKKYGEGHKKNEEVLSTIDKSSHNTQKEIAKT